MAKSRVVCITVALLVLLVVSKASAEIPKPWLDIDFGGATLHMYVFFNNQTPLGPAGTYLWSDPDPRLQAHIEEVEEMFNCKLTFTIGAGWDPVRTSALAGDKDIDMIQVHSGLMVDLARDGFIYPLTDILDEDYYATVPAELAHARNAFTIGGNTWGFAGVHRNAIEPFGLLWNQPLFEEQGLPNIYELYDAGEWTWDAFLQIARAATKDTTGDGEIDQFGYNQQYGVNYLRYWPAFNNFWWFGTEEDTDTVGKVVLDDPRMSQTLEFLHQLESEGLVGHGIALEKEVMVGPTWVFLDAQQLRANAGFGIAPLPYGPQGDPSITIDGSVSWGAVVPITTAHDPRAIIEVTSALWQTTEPYIHHMSVYRDMDDWKENYWSGRMAISPDRRTYEMWEYMETHARPTFEATIFAITHEGGAQTIWTTLYNDVILGGSSPAAALAQLQQMAETLMESYLPLYE